GTEAVEDVAVGRRVRGRGGDGAPAALAALALLVHQRVEGRSVDGRVALERDLLGELDREPEGVVQLEGDGARHLPRRQLLVEQLRTGAQGLPEPRFLALDDAD